MDIEDLFNTSSIIDLSFFNFRNAITAAYFADSDLRVKRVNKNFLAFFPILKNIQDAYFPDVLSQIGINSETIDKFLSDINSEGRVLLSEILIPINGEDRFFSLLSTRTIDQDFSCLNGVQGQFVDRTAEVNLRRQAEQLLVQQTHDKEVIAEKSQTLENLANKLSKYLSPQVYQNLFSTKDEAEFAISRKNLTIFFSDIAKFTDLSDSLEPEQLAAIINSYLSEMATIAIECGGTIDKFIGDAVLVFFGDPESNGKEQDALNCLKMAARMSEKIEEFQEYWASQGATRGIKVRMGITTGFCTVGNFGSDQRMDYTVLGGPVNLAARLQALAPSDTILVSETTHSLLRGHGIFEEFDRITPKGFTREIQVFTFKGFKNDRKPDEQKAITRSGKYVNVRISNVSGLNDAISELKNIEEELKSLNEGLDESSQLDG